VKHWHSLNWHICMAQPSSVLHVAPTASGSACHHDAERLWLKS
jgi:hypothetical protein